jgi:multicomponent Na+:H+ antiporter subunit G
MIFDVIAAVLLLLGALLCVAAGVGLLRFPDVLSRTHAVAKPQILGLILILTGLAVRLRSLADLPTLLLVIGFQLATAPVAAHMIGRAAYRVGILRKELLLVDEAADSDASPPSHSQ